MKASDAEPTADSTDAFDVAAVFDPDDYLYFYHDRLTPERTEREVDLIWRLLELTSGTHLLDLACGHGRIANRLAVRGCPVVGLDATAGFLQLARHDAAGQGLSVEYVQGDMRALPPAWIGRFDRILNWFTAYGYFGDDENRQVLREAQRALVPGGKLLIELNNRDMLLRNLQHAVAVTRDDNIMIDQTRYDVPTGRMLTERTILRDGRVRHMRFFVRMFTFPELRDWLLQAGFGAVAGFDQEGAPLTLESRRMLVVATKGGTS
jgi:SAM-dependent methyltransferase